MKASGATAARRTAAMTSSDGADFSTSAEAPLTIDAANSKITLKGKETREFSVSGGTQPLTVRWNGAVPPANVLDFVYLPPRTIRLMAKQVTEGSYNLLISDRNSAVNVEITLSRRRFPREIEQIGFGRRRSVQGIGQLLVQSDLLNDEVGPDFLSFLGEL